MYTDLTSLCIGQERPVHQVLAQMNTNQAGIVLVVDGDGRLLDTITDGDVRRAILANVAIDFPVSRLLEQKAGSSFAQPIVAPVDADPATLLNTLQQHEIRHLPVIDQERRVVGLVTLDEFIGRETLPLQAVVMAGGLGTRLSPLTDELPKPMLPVGDHPILELIIEQLRQSGISKVNLATHYKKDIISGHFGDGSEFGVGIQYVEEDQPLGTAGALSLLEDSDDPLLVINGDILTQVDFRNMLAFHQEHEADMSVAVRHHELQLPYGVVTVDGVRISGITEKPVIRHLINAGIYLLEPSVRRYIPSGRSYDMPDLITNMLRDGRRVVSFPIGEYWVDIGRHADYEHAQEFVNDQKGGK